MLDYGVCSQLRFPVYSRFVNPMAGKCITLDRDLMQVCTVCLPAAAGAAGGGGGAAAVADVAAAANDDVAAATLLLSLLLRLRVVGGVLSAIGSWYPYNTTVH